MNDKRLINEIKSHVEFIFKDFDFDEKSKDVIENVHKLLKQFESLERILFYDINSDLENKIVEIKITENNNKIHRYIIKDE